MEQEQSTVATLAERLGTEGASGDRVVFYTVAGRPLRLLNVRGVSGGVVQVVVTECVGYHQHGEDYYTEQECPFASAELASPPWDRGERNRVHAGDTVSVLTPVNVAEHDGVGEVIWVGRSEVVIADSAGRRWCANASDVSVDWTDYPPES